MTDIHALQYTGDKAVVNELRQKILQSAAVGNLENRPHLYLSLLYKIHQCCEKQIPIKKGDQCYDKKKKHVRLFGLLPTKSFECSNIKISGTRSYSLLKRQCILEVWTEGQYEETIDKWWMCLFQIDKFETQNRTFAGEILTDSVSVSLMMRSKKPREQCEREAELAMSRGETWSYPIKKKPGPKAGKALKKQYDQPDIDLSAFDHILGLDPGHKSMFATCDSDNDHLQCSRKQLYHNAKSTD